MTALTAVLVASSLALGQTEVKVPANILKEMGYLVGEWKSEGTFEGKPSKATYSAQWAPGKHCLVLTSGSNEIAFSGISGWDPATGNLVETWYRSDGVRVEIRYSEFSATTWKGTVRVTDAAGKTANGTVRLQKTAEGFTADGKTDDGKTVITRHRRLADGDKQAVYRRWLKYLPGEWTSRWSGQGINLDGESEIRLVGDHTLRVTGKSADGPTAEVIGWRADKQRMVFNGYGAKNGYWHAEYDDLQDDRLRGRVSGLLADGRAVSGSIELKRTDDDHYEGRFDGTADGAPLPLTARFTRKKK